VFFKHWDHLLCLCFYVRALTFVRFTLVNSAIFFLWLLHFVRRKPAVECQSLSSV